jgi:hypothetical protein
MTLKRKILICLILGKVDLGLQNSFYAVKAQYIHIFITPVFPADVSFPVHKKGALRH